MKSGPACAILLGAALLSGCVTAKLTETSTTVTVIGEGDVRACRQLDLKEFPDLGTTTRSEYCIEIQGEGISKQGAGVLNTLISPIRYLGRLLINPLLGS
jgi:hypothetical protein